MTTASLYLVIGCLAIATAILLYYCIKFGLTILRIQDALEESLAIIDKKYESMKKIYETPLFYDSPEVRRVVEDIKGTQKALYDIAAALSSEFEVEAIGEDTQGKKEDSIKK